MGVEIERKFLVRDMTVLAGVEGIPYRQGYLSTDPQRTVRVRRAGDRAFLTIKGLSEGATRAEFEYAIPVEDAEAMFLQCLPPIVAKVRHRVPHAGLTWEVDVFGGENEGLVVAEVEIPSQVTAVVLPPWVGDEVTDDPRYFNANLVAHPYRDWR